MTPTPATLAWASLALLAVPFLVWALLHLLA
jgi:hypothetical protein